MKFELYLHDISAEFPADWSKKQPWKNKWEGHWPDNWQKWEGDWKQPWGENWKVDWGEVWGDWKSDWGDWKNDWQLHWGSDWTADWDNLWQKNLEMQPPKDKIKPYERLLSLELRDEEFGGIFFDPVSQGVFKADHEGFKVIKLLKDGMSIREVQKELDLKDEEISTLVEFIDKYNLW
jgi:hypothetical protein